jgi:hypothetical protein
MRPRRFTMRKITCSSAPVYNAAAGSSVMADLPMIDFSFTVVIINSAVDIFWLTYQVKSIHHIFILYVAFFKKSNYSGLQVFPMQDKLSIAKRDYYIAELLDNPCRFISRSSPHQLVRTVWITQ